MRKRFFAKWVIGSGIGAVILAMAIMLQISPSKAQDDGGSKPPPNNFTGDNSYCLVCHASNTNVFTLPDGTTYSLEITRNVKDSLVHGLHIQEGLGCVDCHGYTMFPHIRNLPETKEAYLELYVPTCNQCHLETDLDTNVASFNFNDISQEDKLTGTVCLECHQSTENWEKTHEGTKNNFNVAVQNCGDCHTTTVDEWHRSAHGEQQLACSTCHISEERRLRFETVQTLCLNCHENARDDFTHITHVNQSCSDCHWDTNNSSVMHVLNSGAWEETGHDLSVEIRSCLTCHNNPDTIEAVRENDEELSIEGIENHPLLVADTRIKTLENDLEETEDEQTNMANVRLVQSALLGLAAGGILTLLVLRFNRLNQNMPTDTLDEVKE
jgi:hypothetical protein